MFNRKAVLEEAMRSPSDIEKAMYAPRPYPPMDIGELYRKHPEAKDFDRSPNNR